MHRATARKHLAGRGRLPGPFDVASILHDLDAVVWQAEVLDAQRPTMDNLRLSFISRRAANLFGRRAPSTARWLQIWRNAIHPDDRDMAMAAYASALAGVVPEKIEYRVIRGDGRVIWLRDRVFVVRDRDGRPLRMRGLLVETTERREMEQALRESAERFALAAAGSNDGLWDWQVEAKRLYLSPRWKAIIGFADSELPNEPATWHDRIHPDDRERFATEFAAHLAGEIAHFENEHRLRCKDGSYRWVLARGQSIRDEHGRATRVAGSMTDITPRKKMEQHLLETVASSQAIFRAFPDLYFRLTPDGLIIDYYARHVSDFFIPPEQFFKKKVTDSFPPFVGALIMNAIGRVCETGAPTGIEYALPKDGTIREYEARLFPAPAGDVIAIVRDITDRKQAEAQLLASVQRQAAVSELGQRALEGVDVNVLMTEACELVGRVLNCEYTSICELVPNGKELLLRAGQGWRHGLVGMISVPIGNASEAGYALSVHLPVISSCLQRETRFQPSALLCEHGVQSSANVIIHGPESPIGVLGAHSRRERVFSDGTIHFLQSIANVLGVAIARRRSEEKMAVLLDAARTISGMVDLDELLRRVERRAAEALQADAVVTFYWDATRRCFRMISHYNTPAVFVAALERLEFSAQNELVTRLGAGRPLVINDPDTEIPEVAALLRRFQIGAMVAVQLRVRGRELGAFTVFRKTGAVPFDSGEVELCDGIARQLALAIEGTELYRAQQEEAEVSFTLARVGREMMSSLNTPALLQRLCRETAQALDSDFSHTWLWREDEQVFVAVAGWGDATEQWESMRVLRIPRSLIAGLVERISRDDVVQILMSEPQDLIPPELPRKYGITRAMYVALRRGEELLGILTAGYLGRTEPFSAKQERIMRGIAQLTSIALANARLFEELQRANDLKSDFVATMSHELRTPLNVILGYNELLLDGLFGPLSEEQADTARRIRRNARELLDLINATLDLSRLEGGRLPVEFAPVSVRELIEEIDRETQDLRQKPGLTFAWEVHEPLATIVTDAMKLKLILKNLINNAIKFTDTGSVTVAVHPRLNGIEFAVVDTGIGIAPEAQSTIFEPFRQADRSIMNRFGGVGLGLYIVRRMVNMLGGTISLESEIGHGSTFRVWLPDDGRRVIQRPRLNS